MTVGENKLEIIIGIAEDRPSLKAFKEYMCNKYRVKTVVDLYGGSGSTLIGCEKKGLQSRLMELDPHYCDVIRKRYTKWAKENGKPITSGCLE